jgi:hypothetical protein
MMDEPGGADVFSFLPAANTAEKGITAGKRPRPDVLKKFLLLNGGIAMNVFL